MSDNAEAWWDNRKTAYLGWQPQDSSDAWAGEFADEDWPADAPKTRYQGGVFTTFDHPGTKAED
jgi:uronate dehydrogenase